jgi:hypothetical protein
MDFTGQPMKAMVFVEPTAGIVSIGDPGFVRIAITAVAAWPRISRSSLGRTTTNERLSSCSSYSRAPVTSASGSSG